MGGEGGVSPEVSWGVPKGPQGVPWGPRGALGAPGGSGGRGGGGGPCFMAPLLALVDPH